MRHAAAVAMGAFLRPVQGGERFHKEIGIHDLYDGGGPAGAPPGRLGGIQQLATPPLGLLEREMPGAAVQLAVPLRRRLTGMLVLAEDQPRPENRVRAGASGRPVVEHRHTPRDLAARDSLLETATEVLGRAGAVHLQVVPVATFSHALGTVRMGPDPRTPPSTARAASAASPASR